MSTDPLADRAEMHVPTTDEVRVNMVADLNGSDPLTAERLGQFDRWLAAHDAQVRAAERQKVEAEVRELRAELEHPALGLSAWRAVAAQRLVRAEKAEAELARIRALLADEGTVEKVAEAVTDAQVAANGKAALRNLCEAFDRIKAEEWRIFVAATGYDPEDPSEDDYGTCVREAVAQVRADERQKVSALLADEHTVKTVADAICISVSGWPDHHGAWTDEARAALDALAGLIGGEE